MIEGKIKYHNVMHFSSWTGKLANHLEQGARINGKGEITNERDDK